MSIKKVNTNLKRKTPHTGDKESLDRCGQQHRYQENPASKAKFAKKTNKQKELCGDLTPFMSKSFQF